MAKPTFRTCNVIVCDGVRVHLVPKVGLTSMKKALQPAKERHVFAYQVGPEFRFMAVRHPFDRLVSAWANFIREEAMTKALEQYGYPRDCEFKAFFDVAMRNHDQNKHTRSQADFLGPWIPHLCPLEQLDIQWERHVRARNPKIGPIGRFNHSPARSREWREYYTQQMLARAHEVYAPDLALYEMALKNKETP